MQPRLLIPIGIPGSGKSTWSKTILCGYEYVSTDNIRDSMYGDDPYDHTRNKTVFERYHFTVDWYLKHEVNIIADATNLQSFARQALQEIAALHKAQVHYVVFVNVAQAVQRNAARKETDPRWWVPDDAMIRFVTQYEAMLRDIKTESHDSLTFIQGTQ